MKRLLRMSDPDDRSALDEMLRQFRADHDRYWRQYRRRHNPAPGEIGSEEWLAAINERTEDEQQQEESECQQS